MPQRFAAVAISFLLHVAALVSAMWLGQRASQLPHQGAAPSAMSFVFALPVIEPPSERFWVPREILATPVSAVDTPDERLEAPPPEITRAEVTPPVREPQLPEPPLIPKPVVPRPVPVTGVFPDGNVSVRNAVPGLQVRAVGFDAAPARPPDLKTASAVVGAFETPAALTQLGSDRTANYVVAAGFGGAVPPLPSSASARTLGDAGFRAATGAAAPPRDRRPADIVRPSEFTDARAVPRRPAERRPERIDTPLEVLFKPSPLYTDEARMLKLEGEVVLEAEFSASSKVRVLRVVRGLGHGLDESATRAAEQIRFKPAQSNGRPVDFRTTVHIVFRLT